MPSPTETLLRVQLSPLPTQTVCGFDGSMAMAPMDCTGCLSNTGLKVVPPSMDFHTPPLAAPTNSVVRPSLPLTAASAAMRPLMAAEPMLRAPRPEMVPLSKAASAAKAPAAKAARAKPVTMRFMAGSSALGRGLREMEQGFFGRRVDLDALGREHLLVGRALLLVRHGQREVHAVHLLVVAELGARLALDAAHEHVADAAD